jgi:Septum formation
MRCSECGAETAEAAQVCVRCAAPIADQPSTVADPAAGAVQNRCLECGAESAGTTDVCARCGAPVAYQPSVAGDQAVGQQVKPRRSARGPLIVVGLAIAVLVAIGVIAASKWSTSSTDQLTYDQLQPGDCLNGSNLGLGKPNPWPEYVTTVPCTQKHLGEVFFSGNVWPQSQTTYPGDNAISNEAKARCSAAFGAYDGIDYSSSAFSFDWVVPGSDSWAAGGRQVVCVAYQPGVPVNYSIKGSNK